MHGWKTTSDTLAVAQASGRFSRNVQTVAGLRGPIGTKETVGSFALHINGSLLGSQVGRNFNSLDIWEDRLIQAACDLEPSDVTRGLTGKGRAVDRRRASTSDPVWAWAARTRSKGSLVRLGVGPCLARGPL